jgi:PhnB protein
MKRITTKKTPGPRTSGIPSGHRSLAPYLYVRGASRAMDFYARAFGARELWHMPAPDGSISHAEMQVGDSVLMLADEDVKSGSGSPERYKGSAASVFLYVADVDAVFAAAIAAGARPQMPPTDMFWGDRFSVLTDPFGHRWSVATHVEDVSPEEMVRRQQKTEHSS